MNVFLAKILMYHQIQQLSGEGHSLNKISAVTGLHWSTIKKYLSMTETEFEEFQNSLSDRKKQLLPYEGFVKEKLEMYRDTSAAQMHDWLKEHFTDFPKVNPKTVFNFVHWVRGKYNLPVIQQLREYETVPECAYGKQAQVDFGEYTMRNSMGARIKVFFFSMMLSRSRQKYLWFSVRAFTSELAVLILRHAACLLRRSWISVVVIAVSSIDSQLRETEAGDNKIGTAMLLKDFYEGENDEIEWLRKLRKKYVHHNLDKPFLEMNAWFNNQD